MFTFQSPVSPYTFSQTNAIMRPISFSSPAPATGERTHTQGTTSTSSPLKPPGYSHPQPPSSPLNPTSTTQRRRPPPTLPPPSARRQKNLTQTVALLKHQREKRVREGRGGEDEIMRVIIAAERRRREGEMEEEARRAAAWDEGEEMDADGDFEMDGMDVGGGEGMEMYSSRNPTGGQVETRTCPECWSDELVAVDGGSVCFECGAVEGVVSV